MIHAVIDVGDIHTKAAGAVTLGVDIEHEHLLPCLPSSAARFTQQAVLPTPPSGSRPTAPKASPPPGTFAGLAGALGYLTGQGRSFEPHQAKALPSRS